MARTASPLLERATPVVGALFLIGVAGATAWGIDASVLSRVAAPVASATPVDEVTLARQASFDRRFAAATEALTEALEERGVAAADVRVSSFTPRSADGLHWRREEVTVDVPGEPEALAAALGARLTKVSDATHALEPDTESSMILTIKVEGHETHRLVVRPLLPQGGARVAVIIDDIGYRKKEALALMEIEAPITFSVLPAGPYSRDLAALAWKKGREIMLHLPLEPDRELGGVFPEDIIRADLPEPELRARVRDALLKVPQASGVNNHMGSLFTKKPAPMGVVLEEIHKKGLYFVDSRTTPESVAGTLSREMGLPTTERNVFLDDDADYEATVAQLEKTGEIARQRGFAVAIGHPYPTTVAALRDAVPRLEAEGIHLVPVSDVLSADALTRGATP